ncbi:unnamed protein product [Ambrosiozyma monospora]|uniref:Unnamed protein product n=1 Tax=Ambrosiozyma monospora TaxID=43982 RepID=A0ACB5U9H1_AMBMO|nr:unnamed protein product [Ambrosiozyma monospora]
MLFTKRRVELVSHICFQGIVSLEKTKMYSQLLMAKKAAEEATSEKASFLANMSHEIRTPFNSLLSCAIFLLDTKLSEVQKSYVETIRNSALDTLNIIDGILAFTKIEHGSISLDYSPFSLTECIESAIQMATEQASTKGLEIVYMDYCHSTDVYGDVNRIRQILVNIIGNAVKFTKKGYVLIETSCSQVDCSVKLTLQVEESMVVPV